MKQHLRLALPPLDQLDSESQIAFVLVNRQGRVARAGELAPAQLAAQCPSVPVYAVLHPDDAVVTQITVPPVSSQRLSAAVLGSVEPLVLSDLDHLCVAHSPRNEQGEVTVAWATRRSLAQAWSMLSGAGLDIAGIYPHPLAVPQTDGQLQKPLALPAGPQWLAPLPSWSLAHDSLRPATAKGRWGKAVRWAGFAAVVWIVGLNVYAARLQGEVKALEHSQQAAVLQAFPEIPIVIDPLRQARNQLESLRLTQGISADDDFMPLALATAQVLEFAQSHVRALQYANGELILTLAEGYAPPGNEAALAQAAAAQQIMLAKDDARPHVWRAKRATSMSNGASAS